jgi:DNA-binding SARP family transcriptional activator
MLGVIEIAHADAEPEPLRGVRIRTLLGLLVADQMVGRSLSPREFVQIAGGSDEENPELARKKRNMAVVRLREAIGADAILTDEKTPRLNLARVEVDLLRADDLVKRALAAGREGALVRAQPLLIEALELTRGEVPFPTLYETFFEAAREDFEYRLRTAIIDIAQGALSEGDAGGAEEILRRGFEAMPDDEQVAELLQQALSLRGNRLEAERIRLRIKEGV